VLAPAGLAGVPRLSHLTMAATANRIPRTAVVCRAGVLALAFSPDGRTLAAGLGDATVSLCDVAGGKEREALRGHGSAVQAVAFVEGGKGLCAGGADGTVRLWLVDHGPANPGTILHRQTGRVTGVAATANGEVIVSCGDDQAVSVLQHTGPAWSSRFPDLEPVPAVRCLAFAPDCRTAATGHADRTVRLWKCAPGVAPSSIRLAVLAADVLVLKFDRSGEALAAGCADGRVWVWDVRDFAPARPVVLYGRTQPVLALDFLQGPQTLTVVTGRPNAADPPVEVAAWDIVPEAQTESFAWRGAKPTGPGDIAFAPEGRLAVWGGQELLGMELASGRRRAALLPAPGQPIRSLAFGPDGRCLGLGLNGGVRLYDWRARGEGVSLEGPLGGVDSVAVAPAGKRVVASGASVVAWDTATKAHRLEWRPPVPVPQVLLASDGRHLLTANGNGTVYVIRLASQPH
jgi:WD40 repeat protein